MKPFPNMLPVSTDEMHALFADFTARLQDLGLGEKHKEYANNEDCLSNFRIYSWRGILCTITQKLGRMLNYASRGTEVKESVFMNDCLDSAFYFFLMYCCYRSEQKWSDTLKKEEASLEYK